MVHVYYCFIMYWYVLNSSCQTNSLSIEKVHLCLKLPYVTSRPTMETLTSPNSIYNGAKWLIFTLWLEWSKVSNFHTLATVLRGFGLGLEAESVQKVLERSVNSSHLAICSKLHQSRN